MAVRALGELAIIVVGVLVAFQVEDLRNGREARNQEVAALNALELDLGETLTRLESDISRQAGSIDAQSVLLDVADGQLPMLAPDSMAYLVFQAMVFQRLEAVTGSYDALVSAGDLRLIRNDSIRASLASLFGSMGDGYEDEDMSTLFRNAYMMAMSNTSTLRSATGDRLTERLNLSGRPPSADYNALLGDRLFVTALAAMAIAEGGQLAYCLRFPTCG